ncbi:hypothetical protein TDB9533_03410 [Thalassocella blandensis]|nr:hypothetical protein TDB9533_03410 [Thalassocella blandensis]
MLQYWQTLRDSFFSCLLAQPWWTWQYWRNNRLWAFQLLCYALVILAILYRIDYIIEFNPIYHIFSDTRRHWEQGIDVLRGDPMVFTDPILFQVYIAALAKLTLKYPPLVAFYTIILCSITPWLWYRFVRELQPSKTLALVAWVVLSWNPSWISIYGYFMQETLLLPMLGAALWATWRCKRKQTAAAFTLMVLIWALAGLSRGIAIPMAAVACTWLWCVQAEKIRKGIYSLLVLALILGPLTYRGYQFVHIFAPHGMGNMNLIYAKSGKRKINMNYERQGARWFYVFQSPAAEARVFEPLSDWQSRRRGAVTAFVDLDEGSRDWELNMERTTLSLKQYVDITLDNMILLFFSESWPDSNRARTLGEVNYQSRWLWAPLTVLILIASIVWRKRLRQQKMYAAILIAWFVVQALLPIAVNEGRYRMPFTGMLLVQALLLFNRPSSTNSQRGQVPLQVMPVRRFPSRSGQYRARTPLPRKRWKVRLSE